MPSTGKLLFASIGVAWAKVVPVPKWVLGAAKSTCKDTCEKLKTGAVKWACDEDSKWPMSQTDFETILENIQDDSDSAKCSAFVDHKGTLDGPYLSKGVCWYHSQATKFDCTTAAGDGEQPVCRCYESKFKETERDPIPAHIPYPAVYKRAEKASISFTIKFPFFTKDAFECLGAQAGKKVTGTAKKHPEAFFKMAHGIRQSLGTEAAGIQFVAPKMYSDPLEAKVDVYAAPVDMSRAEMFLAKSRIRDIGPYLVKKYPELKMCALQTTAYETYETEFGNPPVYPTSVKPTGSWSPARKDEVSNDSMVLTLGFDVAPRGGKVLNKDDK